ncbi:putative triacylglycerol lipase [Lupinus albus]|uniref:Putative triacylglycerol lipase n=1 Tax=Lupinus albus TaxID=3870 RepID=A0A6A4R4Y6_LUPAL|nr:putative triacylglycerol lipase [Lupinus albus]
MGYSSSLLITCFLLLVVVLNVANGKPLVPALFIFGDSVVDSGNNNNLLTFVKANFPPYGRDFKNHTPTGRFCNGKLAIDFIAETLGFTSYQPAYLNLEVKGKNLLNGANFASAASGFFDFIPRMHNTIPFYRQLEYYQECQNKLVEIVGPSKASSIISDAIYIVNDGSSDFRLYAMGARRIGVTSVAPMGCLPILITVFGSHNNECVDRLNNDSIYYNEKLNKTSENLRKTLPDIKLVVFDIYQPLYNLVDSPSDNGFSEVRRGCCGTGLLETAITCNNMSIGTCANASKYVFWDSVHPSEATNKILADSIVVAGIPLIMS